MVETIKLTLPTEFVAVVRGQEKEPIPNKHTGYVTVPSSWTGKDWEEFWRASRQDEGAEHVWLRQWKWAKARIVEWAIDGLPTNPNQLEDDKLPFALIAWLMKSVHAEMVEYMERESANRRATLSYPEPGDISVGEFFAWEKVVKELPEDDERSLLLRAWSTGRVLIRSWANGSTPAADGLDVDLALLAAVDDISGDVIGPSLDLGNSRAPRG